MLVDANADNVHRGDNFSATPIIYVTWNRSSEYLIQNGTTINDVGHHGQFDLYTTSFYGRIENIKLLIAKGAYNNLDDINGSTS